MSVTGREVANLQCAMTDKRVFTVQRYFGSGRPVSGALRAYRRHRDRTHVRYPRHWELTMGVAEETLGAEKVRELIKNTDREFNSIFGKVWHA